MCFLCYQTSSSLHAALHSILSSFNYSYDDDHVNTMPPHTHTHIILHIHVEKKHSLWQATMELYTPNNPVDDVIAHKVIVAKIRALNDILWSSRGARKSMKNDLKNLRWWRMFEKLFKMMKNCYHFFSSHSRKFLFQITSLIS